MRADFDGDDHRRQVSLWLRLTFRRQRCPNRRWGRKRSSNRVPGCDDRLSLPTQYLRAPLALEQELIVIHHQHQWLGIGHLPEGDELRPCPCEHERAAKPVELGFGSGAGTGGRKTKQEELRRQLEDSKQKLLTLRHSRVARATFEAASRKGLLPRAKWLGAPEDAAFPVDEWISYTASENGDGAAISAFWPREQIVGEVKFFDRLQSALDVFLPLMDAIYDRIDGKALPTAIPDQSPAPVRVEERDGKIAQVSNRDSPLDASERDFNAWREPVIDHVQELLSSDFRLGTNHSRARDRLVALSKLLPGEISDVKERQFRIGYEIERMEGLISAYRSGGDDMPELNAAAYQECCRIAGRG
jgi:hypothetical protein